MSSTATLTKNMIDHVETWLGENIMGDMHIVSLHRVEGFRRRDGASEDRADARWIAVLRSRCHGRESQPPDVAALAPAPAPPAVWHAAHPRAEVRAAAPLTVTSEKLGEGLYRLTTGPGSYDSVIVGVQGLRDDARGRAVEARGLRISLRRSSFPTSRFAT